MDIDKSVFAYKLYEMEEQYGKLQCRIRICEQGDRQKIHSELEKAEDEYKENTIPSISNEIYNNLYEDDYQNTSNKDIWILDYCSLYYDSNKWEETTIMGNPALQYKDTGASYLGYVGGYLLEEEINIKSIDIEKDFLEKMVERLLENEGFTVSNGEWKEINDDLIVLKAVAEKDNTKMPYYFYITNNSINGFLIIDLSENTHFTMEEAEKVMNTLK